MSTIYIIRGTDTVGEDGPGRRAYASETLAWAALGQYAAEAVGWDPSWAVVALSVVGEAETPTAGLALVMPERPSWLNQKLGMWQSHGNTLMDGNGQTIGELIGDNISHQQDRELATYVAALVNWARERA